jgi:hypothetical protein
LGGTYDPEDRGSNFLPKFGELHWTTWHHIPEDNTLQINLTSAFANIYILEKNNGSFHGFISLFKILEFNPDYG